MKPSPPAGLLCGGGLTHHVAGVPCTQAIIGASVAKYVLLVLLVGELVDLQNRNTRPGKRTQRPKARDGVRRPPDEDVRQDAGGQNLLNLLVLLGLVELVFEDLDVEALQLGGVLDPLDEPANVGFAGGAVERDDRRPVLRERCGRHGAQGHCTDHHVAYHLSRNCHCVLRSGI